MELEFIEFKRGYFYTPKSKAKVYNVFTQKFIINVIKDEEPKMIFIKIRTILEKLSINGGIEHFIHKNIQFINSMANYIRKNCKTINK